MYSLVGSWTFLQEGFPIRVSADITLADSSPRLIAANYALLRLFVPRHPPYALSNLIHNATRCEDLHTLFSC